ncbi:MAG: aldehyde dehydrogenase [Erysipelotrichaceae bacterium]|nr:aldehyde dehydrogenase [Erysipelotrichaceae bacterium]MDY5252114.1 aldehyde dehydrogenase [Erysipelotrichaceae bacterium]
MEAQAIHEIVVKQTAYFRQGHTLDVKTRIEYLKKLKAEIIRQEPNIHAALFQDLGKCGTESYMCETGMVLSEINHMIKHTARYASYRYHLTPMAQFHATSYQVPSPYGVVLVMSPWNYPFMLTLDPLIDALAAGNTVCVKPSAYSKHTSEVIKTILNNVFPEEYVSVITGGRKENQALLDEKFDYIFFTGSPNVGHEVMAKASVHLTPITLELGGKSPVIVDETANIKLAARRIVFGKYLNAGQTCVACDYLYAHENIKDELLKAIVNEINTQFGSLNNYGKIINEKHFDRILGLVDPAKVVIGGQGNRDTFQIEPTVMDNVTWDDKVMQEEIFGPILPVLTYRDLDELMTIIADKPAPLALYFFSRNKQAIRKIEKSLSFGGGCINDTIIHLATPYMPFGGVGNSGMGQYHGKTGFETFSHLKSIVNKKNWIDLPIRYQPYTKQKDKLIRLFLK